jgi:hypothetical protein
VSPAPVGMRRPANAGATTPAVRDTSAGFSGKTNSTQSLELILILSSGHFLIPDDPLSRASPTNVCPIASPSVKYYGMSFGLAAACRGVGW